MTERLTADERAVITQWAEWAARLILELRDELSEERETKQQLGDAYRAAQRERDAALARVEWLEETLRDYANRANWGKGVGVPEKMHQLPARIWKPNEDGYARAIRVLASPDGTTEGECRVQADQLYPTYGRLSDRLCVNLATLMFPSIKKLSA